MTETLDSIGLSVGTDKSSWGHDYLQFYEDYFFRLKDQKITLLEIGVAGGASLRVWESYFPTAAIIGADINPDAMKLQRDRVKIEIVDQSDRSQLQRLGHTFGDFDIIIEDGSHMWEHQIASFEELFPFVRAGGLYVVEDMHTNFEDMQVGFRGDARQSCMDYLKQLSDLVVADGFQEAQPDTVASRYADSIDSIVFHKHCCLIKKKRRSLDDQPLVEFPQGSALNAVCFTAHIGGYGDRMTRQALVCGRGNNQNIQGFTIHCSMIGQYDLSARARLADGTWTDWAIGESFVGSRFQGDDLSGFSVRLVGQAADMFDIAVAGRFRRDRTVVVVANGEDCVSRAENDKLWGMQIILTPKLSSPSSIAR